MFAPLAYTLACFVFRHARADMISSRRTLNFPAPCLAIGSKAGSPALSCCEYAATYASSSSEKPRTVDEATRYEPPIRKSTISGSVAFSARSSFWTPLISFRRIACRSSCSRYTSPTSDRTLRMSSILSD